MKRKILIVDDIASNIHMLSNMLKEDYSVIAAKSGQKAIELCKKSVQPDIILLDIMMPVMDGFEVCKVLKNDERTKDIPIFFISSLDDQKEQEKGYAAGGDDYLIKPISKEILLKKVKSQLEYNDLKNDLRFNNKHNGRIDCKKDKQMDSKQKVLIVDDAPENLQVALEILKEDYIVTVAKSGQKALEILNKNKDIDLILLDIIMPNMSGLELCQNIKQNSDLMMIPIIFLTVLENKDDILKGFKYGAVDYVTKPFEPMILKARVQTHLKLKKFQDNLLNTINEKDQILIKQSKLASMGEMFESIMHQWKQPLSVISMSNANIRVSQELETLTKDNLVNMLDEIDSSTKHLTDTIDVFRDFLNEDEIKQYLRVKDLISKTLKLLSSKITNRSIQININSENEEVYTFKNELIQVLMNIISNAIDALDKIKENRVIDISTEFKGSSFKIKICNNGPQIDQEVLNLIFNKYFTTKTDKKGSGIGLYICKKILEENLDGTIDVLSNNKHTCFEIVFKAT